MARARRAFSMPWVISLLLVAALFVGLIGTLMVQDLQSTRRGEAMYRAQLSAENALTQTFQQIAANSTFASPVVYAEPNADPAREFGSVDFSSAAGQLRSINNLAGNSSLPSADGRLAVPAQGADLVATGHSNGYTVSERWVVTQPDFPYALASTGPLRCTGSFFLGAVDDPSVVAQGMSSSAFQEALKPASLVSNSASSPAISITGSPVRVTGNLISPGTIINGTGVEVDGLVEPGHAPVALPAINVTSFDPTGQPLLDVIAGPTVSDEEDITGFARCSGPLTLNGPLNLSEGVLYVDGDLTVNGPVSGIGAIIATGNVTAPSISVSSLQQLALVAGGDVSITGAGSSMLVGLLYSKGNLTLSGVTVVGAVVAAGESGQTLSLNNVNMIGSPKGVAFSFTKSFASTISQPISGLFSINGGRPVELKLVPAPGTNQHTPPVPFDFAPPNPAFNPNTNLQVVDAQSGAPVSGVSASSLLGVGGSNTASAFYASVQVAVTGASSSSPVVVNGSVNLNLNRFLSLSNQLKVVYRQAF